MLDDLARTPARRALPLLLLVLAPALQAQQTPTPPPAATQQREHIVKPGDTLWDLARLYLGNPFLWPLIYQANNPATVENPHWIFPTERLIIPALQPAEPIGDPAVVKPEPVEQPVEQMPETKDEPTVAATLDMRRPIVALSEYRSTPWLSTVAEREVIGRILRVADPAQDEDRLPTSLHPQQRVHLGSLTRQPALGDTLLVVRFGRRIGEYGLIVEPLAILRVEWITPTVVTAQVVRQFGEAKLGDQVMPMPMDPEIGMGEPADVESTIEGNLLEFLMDEPMHSTADLAFVSLGTANGVGIGDELAVYVPTRAVDNERPERLPAQVVARVRVVRVGDNAATVRVLSTSSVSLRDGLPVRLVRRMP